MNGFARHNSRKSLFFLSITITLIFMMTVLIAENDKYFPSSMRDILPTLKTSDLPTTYNQTFTGSYPNYDGMMPSLSVNNQVVIMQNSFSNQQRMALLDLTQYTMPGFSINKVDVNITSNKVTAINDWVMIANNSNDPSHAILSFVSYPFFATYNVLANNITDNYRYIIKQISIDYSATTNNAGVPSPVLELRDSSAGAPHTVYKSLALPLNFTAGWYNATPNYIINASNNINKTWFVAVNGNAWGNSLSNTNLANVIIWYRQLDTTKVDWYTTYSSPATWVTDSGIGGGAFGLEYQRLYLNNENNNNRTFTPAKINNTAPCYLKINTTSVNAQGKATISGMNMKWLSFTSNTTSATFGVTLNVHYTPNIVSNRDFFADGSPTIYWNVTTASKAAFPIGLKYAAQLNFTKPTGWTFQGVYNASTLAGLSTAPSYSKYTVAGNVISINSIKTSSYWQIRCTSPNQMLSVSMQVGGTPVTQANVSNTVAFTASFTSLPSTGNLTLGVYYPSSINNSRPFSTWTTSFSSNPVDLPSTWFISKNILGNYRIQARWNSSSAVGFLSTTLLVIGTMNVNLLSINQYSAPLPYQSGKYQGHYGTNVLLDHTMVDANNGSTIVNLAYTYKINGTTVASGVTSASSQLQLLPFANRVIGTYNIVVTFQRQYYNDFTATYVLMINPCPAITNIIQIKQNNVDVYKNSSNVYCINAGSNFTVYANYTNQYTHEFITNRSTLNVTDGSNQYKNSSFAGQIHTSVRTTDLAANVVLTIQAICNSANYTTSSAAFLLVVDTALPLTSIAYDPASVPNFVNMTTAFVLTGNDPGSCASGVDRIFYNINGTGWVIYSSSFNLGGFTNGTITIQWYSIDKVGNSGVIISTVVLLDTLAPVTQISYSSSFTSGGKNWVTDSTFFTLISSDSDGNGSGVAVIYYEMNGSGWHVYTSQFRTGSSANGTYFIKFHSTDRVGNVENVNTIVVFIDSIAPTTTISFTPVATPDFVNRSTTFTLTSMDNTGGSGKAWVLYQYNGSGGWVFYPSPFTLYYGVNGTITINYFSADMLSNVETIGTMLVRLDMIAPVTTITYNVASAPDFVNKTTVFTLTSLDVGGSGTQSKEYQYTGSGSDWESYTVPFILALATNGTIIISYRSTDYAGNVEFSEMTIVQLDTIAPTTTISFTPNHAPKYANSTTTFTLSALDNLGGSGIDSMYYEIDLTGWTQYGGPFDLHGYPNGTYTISYYSVDKVGNLDLLHQCIVHLDIIGPTIVIASPENQTFGTKDITVILTCNDPDYNASWYTITNMSNNYVMTSNKTWHGAIIETMTNGTFVIQAWGNDTYGNIKQATSVIFTVDTMAPQIQLIHPANVSYSSANLLVELQNFSRTDAVKFRYNNGAGWSINYTLHYNGSRWVNYTLSLADGHYQLQIYANWGVIHNSQASAWFTIDTIAPVTGMIQPAYLYMQTLPYTKNFTTGSAIFTLMPMDDPSGSGIATTFYQVNGGSWTTGTSFSINLYMGTMITNGTFMIGWYSKDQAGNTEGTHHLTVYIDGIAPSTTMIQPTYVYTQTTPYTKNYSNGILTFALNAADTVGSGVATTMYQVTANGVPGSWTSYAGAFTVGSSANGTYMIAWYSTDHLGNVENTLHVTVYIDTITPTTSINQPTYLYTQTLPFTKNYTNGILTFVLNAADTVGSGVATTMYQVTANGVPGSWTSYAGAFTVGSSANGTYMIAWYSTDHLGNVESTHHLTVYIDTIAPTTTIGFTPSYTSGSKNWVTTSTTFTLSPLENSGGSGLAATWYKWSGSGSHAWTSGTSFTLAGMGNGTYTISWCSWDNLATPNNETLKTQVIYIDTIAPTPNIVSYSAIYNASTTKGFILPSATIALSTLDNAGGSGLPTPCIGYKITGISGTSYAKAYDTYSSSFSIATNGTFQVVWSYWDNLLNNATSSFVIRVDTIAPTPNAVGYSAIYNASTTKGFILPSATIALSALDNAGGSGLPMPCIGYKIAGISGTSYAKAYGTYSSSFSIATNGTFQVMWSYWDNLLNNATRSFVIRVDALAPMPNVVGYSAIYNASTTKGFILPTATIALSATENAGGSGIPTPCIGYKIVGIAGTSYAKAYGTYSGSFTIATNGTFQVVWSYWDNVINNATSSFIIRVDTFAPTPNPVSYSAIYNASTTKGFILPTATIALSAADNAGGSVFLAIGYKIAGIAGTIYAKTYGTYSSSFSITTNGTFQVVWSYWDNLLNNATSSFVIRVDTIAPTPNAVGYSAIYNASTTKGFILPSATIVLSALDNAGGSGLPTPCIGYKITGISGTSYAKAYDTYSSSFSIATNGTFQVVWSYWDNLLNNATSSFIIRVDSIAPTTTIGFTPSYTSGSKNWVTTSTTFTLSPLENPGGSGLAATSYKWSGSGSHAWTSGTSFSLAGMGNGTYTISWCSWDNLGSPNNETLKTQAVYIDTIAPSTTINQPSYLYTQTSSYMKNYTNGILAFTLNPVDTGGSGVSSTRYLITTNGVAGLWTNYTGAFTLGSSANGTYTIAWNSTDNVGNVEGTRHLTVFIDKIAPSTTMTQPAYRYTRSVPYMKNYTTGSSTFTLTAGDATGSGVSSTRYLITANGVQGSWKSYSAPFTLGSSTNGTYTIAWNSTDNVGNVEGTHHLTVYIDTIASAVSPSYTASHAPNFVNASTLFTLNAMDSAGGCGVWFISYRIKSGAWINYSEPFTIIPADNGTVVIEYYSTDNAGNKESTASITVRLDVLQPSILALKLSTKSLTVGDALTIRLSCDGTDYNASIGFALLASNPKASGTQQNFMYQQMTNVGDGNYIFTWQTAGLKAGNYTIYIMIQDTAGNVARISQIVEIQPVSTIVQNALIAIICVVGAVFAFVAIARAQSNKKKKMKLAKAKRDAVLLPVTGAESTLGTKKKIFSISHEKAIIPAPQPDEIDIEKILEKIPVDGEMVPPSEPGIEPNDHELVDESETRRKTAPSTTKAEVKPPVSLQSEKARMLKAMAKPTAIKLMKKVPEPTGFGEKIGIEGLPSEVAANEKDNEKPVESIPAKPAASSRISSNDKSKVTIQDIEQDLVAIFNEHGNFIPTDMIMFTEMRKRGYSLYQAKMALDVMARANKVVYRATDPRGWYYGKPETKN